MVGRMALHNQTIKLCDEFLKLNNEAGYQLQVTAALEVGPGARAHMLHREEDAFTFFSLPRRNLIVASMWAIADFRADNGATLVVPGSPTWAAERLAEPSAVIAAEMPASSVLIWLGGTVLGAGPNTSPDWRYGVILTYSLGWWRQEENQYLDVSPKVARRLFSPLRELIGDKMHQALGYPVSRENGG